MISALELMGKDRFKSYSEFYFMLAVGSVLKNRGYCLDMDSMQVEPGIIPDDMIKYYRNLLDEGAIYMSLYEKKGVSEIAGSYVDTTYFDSTTMVKDCGDTLDWTIDFAKDNYGEHKSVFLDLNKLGHTLMHLVAWHYVNHLLSGDCRQLVIHFDSIKAKSTFLYVNIYSILQTMSEMKKLVSLDIDFSEYNVDLDYSIFCNNGMVSGRFKKHSVQDKLKYMQDYGMVAGSILVLWERDGMCENNVYGYVTGAKIIRLDEIGDDFLGVTTIAINKTKEEVRQDYYDIPEELRYFYVDLLDKKPYQCASELSLYNIGIDNYFYDESEYITLLDESEVVTKLVTIDGQVANIEMSGVDAIYWLLCEYEIEFDKNLFKEMYFHGEEPLWEKYN